MEMLKCDYWSWKLNRKRRAKITMRKHLGYTPQFCLRKLEGVEEPDFDKEFIWPRFGITSQGKSRTQLDLLI